MSHAAEYTHNARRRSGGIPHTKYQEVEEVTGCALLGEGLVAEARIDWGWQVGDFELKDLGKHPPLIVFALFLTSGTQIFCQAAVGTIPRGPSPS